jgi:cell division protein FtsQ
MRPLRARERSETPKPRGGRGKNPARAPEQRFEPRGSAKAKSQRRGLFARLIGFLLGAWPARHPMLALTVLLLIGGAAAGVLSGGYVRSLTGHGFGSVQGLFGNAGFRVADITVDGNDRTSRDDVLGALGFAQGDSTFSVDPAAVRERLTKLPWVADAEVQRHFPGTVSVTLIEKHPYALWRDGNVVKVVERSGAVITPTTSTEFSHLPLLAGAGAPQAAALLLDEIEKHRAVAARMRWAERISDRRWDLMLDGKVQVKLPEEGWQAQLGELEHLIVDKGILERDIEMIDLRFPDSYIFRLRNGDSQPVARERPT